MGYCFWDGRLHIGALHLCGQDWNKSMAHLVLGLSLLSEFCTYIIGQKLGLWGLPVLK